MSRLLKSKISVVVLLVASILTPTGATLAKVGIRLAQVGSVSSKKPDIKNSPTFNEGFIDGKRQAEVAKANKYGTGLLAGGFLGLLGTGIGYYMVGPKEIEGSMLRQVTVKGEEYELGFRKGWNEKTKQKKRSSFLTGGLLGTVALFVIVVSVAQNEN